MLDWKLKHKQSSVFHHQTFFFSPCFCGPDWENVVYYGPLELTDWKSDHQIEISFPIFIWYNWSQNRPHAKRNIPQMLCESMIIHVSPILRDQDQSHQFNFRLMSTSRRHHSPNLLRRKINRRSAHIVVRGGMPGGQINQAMEVGILPDLRDQKITEQLIET